MSEVPNVSEHIRTDLLQRLQVQNGNKSKGQADQPAAAAAEDQAEISELGKMLSLANGLPEIRAEKVSAARLAIEQDEAAFVRDRLEVTVDRLYRDLREQ